MDLISFKDKERVSAAFNQMLKVRQIISFSSILISKYGKEVLFKFNAKAIYKNDEAEGLIGVGKNITDVKFYEEKLNDLNNQLTEMSRFLKIERSRSNQRKSVLEELNRLKSEFISNISHELRTPLASIIGFSETIASDPEMPVEMKNEFNQIILNEGKRLARLINDVLDLTRIEQGQIEIIKSDFDIVELLNKVVEENRSAVEKKNLQLTYKAPDDKIIIHADEEKISRVFGGLISNALKFTEPGGRISIYAQNLYKEFEVIISDTGIGIPQKDLQFIFEKFYRVSRPGSEIPGTGLGLVFAKQIVDLHRGLITVQSDINKGTTFVVKLPKNPKIQQK